MSRSLALYHFDSCPFCQRVRRVIDELDLSVELRDIQRDPDHYRALVEATGRQMVPCLRIQDSAGGVTWMHESADIIDFLRKNP